MRVPRVSMVVVKILLVNCRPLSVMMLAGTPKRGIHSLTKVSVTVVALMLVNGKASNHLDYLSQTANRYLKPLETGRGPTRSQ